MTELSKGNSPAFCWRVEEPQDEFHLLQFPVAIEFSDIASSAAADGSASVSCSSGINAPSTHTVTYGIERNKNLCSVTSLNLLTEEEEKRRVAELLLQV